MKKLFLIISLILLFGCTPKKVKQQTLEPTMVEAFDVKKMRKETRDKN